MAIFSGSLFSGLFGNRRQQQLDQLTAQLIEMQSNLSYISNAYSTQQQLLQMNFRALGGFERFDTINQQDFILNGYNASSAVYSIISDIAQKAASIPFKVSYVVDDSALKNYKIAAASERTPNNIYWTNKLRNKALQQVEPDNDLLRLLNNPNVDDDPTVFWQTAIGFELICGNSYLYTPTLDMGADKGKITELRIMPSPYTGIVVTQGFPQKVLGYQLIIAGVQLLTTNEVIHIKYPNYNWTIDGQQLYGLPPLQAGKKTLSRSNSAETSATSMFENGGPGVIVYNESIPPTNLGLEQTSKIKKTNNDEYAGNVNRGKVKYMPGKIGVAELGLSPVDLDILESERWSFDMLCNVFKLHSVLYNIHVSSNYNNIEQLKKDNWTAAYIPPRQQQADAINRRIVPGYNSKGVKYFVELDLSGITDLQPDYTQMSNWAMKIPITPNEQRELFNFEASPDPNMDKIWIPQGMVTMDDAAISVDSLPNMPQDATPPVQPAQTNGKMNKHELDAIT
jgi:HK97 family phage portal protein